jgi:hypothetical protein
MSVDQSKVCRHGTALSRGRCEVGVCYKDVRSDDDIFQGLQRYPCFGIGADTCTRYEPRTPEEIAESEAQAKRRTDLINRGLSFCCEAPIDESHVVKEGRHAGHGPRYCSKCRDLVFLV